MVSDPLRKVRSFSPKPGTRKLQTETQNPKTETRNPEFENRNPKLCQRLVLWQST